MRSEADWFKKNREKTPISPWELNGEGKGQALVLRYAGCNLNCPMCYAWTYVRSPQTYGYKVNSSAVSVALDNLPNTCTKKIVWVRIQGGEPCLNYARILNTINFASKSLFAIHSNNLNYYPEARAVIQTNGIGFTRLTEAEAENVRIRLQDSLASLSRGRIVFEVSFKSPHAPTTLIPQLSGYNILLNQIVAPIWKSGFNNVAVYPIAGLGPSIDLDNCWIVPIDSTFLPREVPLFDRSTWSQAFTNMVDTFVNVVVPNSSSYEAFRSNTRTSNGRKIAIEEFEPTLFQTSWISGYAGRYSELGVVVPPIALLLRRLSYTQDPQWSALFRAGNRVSVLNAIPVSTDAATLLSFVTNMSNYFYPSHPEGHYPFL